MSYIVAMVDGITYGKIRLFEGSEQPVYGRLAELAILSNAGYSVSTVTQANKDASGTRNRLYRRPFCICT